MVRAVTDGRGRLRAALVLAAAAGAGVALWLAWAVATVLPARDPARIPLWSGVAAGMFAFAALSFASLRRGRAQGALRLAAAALGVPAAGLGFGAAARMLGAGGARGHFEGYILVAGLALGAHGALAIAVALGGAPRDAAR